MTLDEWRAMQNQSRAQAAFNIRKPGEGCSDDQWKRTFVLKKKPTEPKTDSDEEESEDEEVHNDSLFSLHLT